jgi:hypothetical protein
MFSKSSIAKNMKKWGYKSHDDDLDNFIGGTVQNFIKSKVQAGGAIRLPSEYFGVDSGRYAADAPSGSSLAVTEDFIRTPLAASDPSGAIVGGGKRFQVSQKVISDALSSVGVSLSAKDKKAIKAAYESKMTELMNSISRKNKDDHLSKSAFVGGLAMKKYSALR